MKKNPLRMCVSCRNMKAKEDLIRIVKKDDKFFIDKTNKSEGRGAYICKDNTCINKCIKSKSLNKNFKCEVDKEIYLTLEEFLKVE